MSDIQELLQSLPPTLQERCRVVRSEPVSRSGQYILYWMHNAIRGHENPALDVALALGQQLDLPVLVYQGLSERYPFASDRHHAFILQGARDVQREMASRNIGYVFHLERPGHRGPHLRTLAESSALTLTEEMPTAPSRGWTERLAATVCAPLLCVDTACIAPMPLLKKCHDRAFRFRQATKALYEERLTKVWSEQPSPKDAMVPGSLPFEPVDLSRADLAQLISECEIDHTVGPVPHTVGGSKAGYQRWEDFKHNGLSHYARRRNNALLDGVSRLSPYLHYGMVSPFRIAREAAEQRAEKYLDELLIWRELAYQFCYFRKDHEELSAIPDWAQETLKEHQSDPRPAIYSWEALARGQTDDPLWDAAQRSLLMQGELHNNVRMTWGKAILHWTESPERALALLIDLNHRYALDGRDPSSYGGILWCLGQFDRPFPPAQPVLGTVRSRSTGGHAKRLDPDAYLEKVTRPIASDLPRVAIIGAGLSGLACGRALQDHGLSVTLFDKGRGVGGRASTRRTEAGHAFDHGAQYFTVRDPRFRTYVDSWIQDGIVAPWEGTIVVLTNGNVEKKSDSIPRYVGSPGMNAICRHLAKDLSINQQVRVSSIEKADNQWLLKEEANDLGAFDVVIVTAPPSQAAELVQPIPSLVEQARSVSMQPCWAVMASFSKPLEMGFDGAFVHDSALSWIARNSSKPGRKNTSEQWVLHGSPEWSESHIDLPPEEASAILLEAFQKALAQSVPQPDFAQAHLWRYSIPKDKVESGCHFDAEQGMGLCGDWCQGGRMEGAFLSGSAMAGRVLCGLIPSCVNGNMS